MIKRLSTAAIGFAFACSIGSAQAGPYFGFDGRHYGELENAPNFGRPKTTEHGKLDHADAPRKCLKPAIRALLEHAEDVDYLCRIGFARHAHPPTDLSFELSLRSAQRERFGDRTGMHGRG